MGWEEFGFNCREGQRALARVILVLRECIWMRPRSRLFLPAFGDTGSLGSPPRRVVYPLGSNLGDSLPFLSGE